VLSRGPTCLAILVVISALGLAVSSRDGRAGTVASCRGIGHAPGKRIAWRAAPFGSPSVYRRPGGAREGRPPADVDWFLVLGVDRTPSRGCWVKLRLPDRPNRAAGWVRAGRLIVRPTPWRVVVSLRERTLTLLEAGRRRLAFQVVVGASGTPTPRGLFSIVHAWRSEPDAFVGSWVLGLTAHSDVLRHFEGGSGEVGIHGRGGASLLDPLGSAASHGCIRMANRSIDRLVATVGAENLVGIPVSVRR
jgi:L,D-transpeptidase catalytic domain